MLDGHYITLYADDMLLYRVIHSAEDFTHVQKGIDNIGNWVQRNHLRLNSNKCKCMVDAGAEQLKFSFYGFNYGH